MITKYEETPLEKYQRLFDFHSYHDTWLRRGVLTQKIPNEKYEKQEYHKVTQMLGGDPKEITKIVKSKGIQNDVHKEVDNYYHSINAEKVLAQRHDLFQKYTFSKSKRPDPLIKKIKVPKKKIISGWPDLADDSDSVMSWGSQIKGSGSEIDTSFHSSKQSVEEPNEDSDID